MSQEDEAAVTGGGGDRVVSQSDSDHEEEEVSSPLFLFHRAFDLFEARPTVHNDENNLVVCCPQ